MRVISGIRVTLKVGGVRCRVRVRVKVRVRVRVAVV